MSAADDQVAGATYGTYVRWAPYEPRVGRIFEPMSPTHPMREMPCPACGHPLGQGSTVLLAIGPGADQEAQNRHATGRHYTAAAIPVHAACAGAMP